MKKIDGVKRSEKWWKTRGDYETPNKHLCSTN